MNNLPWFLLLLPLLSAAAIKFALPRAGKLAAYIATTTAGLMLLGSLVLLFTSSSFSPHVFPWIQAGKQTVMLTLKLDALSKAMLLVVCLIGFLVHLFSLGYMRNDPGKSRYFAGLSIFMFSMTGIVLSSSFLMMFIFWELVGLSSYILIGHWFDKPSAADAAKKAFLTNRIGDFGFMTGILLLWGAVGSVDFDLLSERAAQGTLGLSGGMLTAAILCLFCGAVGKSAQMPLHVWLPDAMEGPTPVSALIHAATMVAAGVFMLARISFLIELDITAGQVIAWTGGITALFAALVAIQQNDIKRVLAYSTLSQLGYMVMAVGLHAPQAAFFHLFTHAFFKGLLFLGAGAIIHACHHEQDMWKMGGLRTRMPLTFLTFAAGTAALCAVPWVTAGFYSKEAILGAAFHHNTPLFVVAALVALLTPFYMTRLLVVTFFGEPRSKNVEKAEEIPPVMGIPLVILATLSIIAGWKFVAKPVLGTEWFPQEHAPLPVMIISIAALVLGAGAAFRLYHGRTTDPLNISILRQKFFIDEIYASFIKVVQDGLATVFDLIDRYLIDGLLVGGTASVAKGLGAAARSLQSGSLQAYTAIIGFGVILLWWISSSL